MADTTFYDGIPAWQKAVIAKIEVGEIPTFGWLNPQLPTTWHAVPEWAKPDPEIEAALPDICRRAGKRIANQPALWCKDEFHRSIYDQPRDWRTGRFISRSLVPRTQACAVGHIEDILQEDFGNKGRDRSARVMQQVNQASYKAVKRTVPQVNDDPDTTPESIADHLYVVADELEFGDD